MKDGKPIILIECKHWSKNLSPHEGQLIRYFQAANVRIGILTNGIRYRIYTDLEKPNMMDEKAFLDFDITELKDFQVEELKRFRKASFDIESIVSTANDLKYTAEITDLCIKFDTKLANGGNMGKSSLPLNHRCFMGGL